MTTNLAVAPAFEEPEPTADHAAGERRLAFAVGTDEAVLRIWPAPTE